jgi:hypothetical protein
LNSKKPEEVRKRRAKPGSSRVNVYQKMILVAGVLTLFLAIGLSPMMAPFLAAGIVGGTLLLFLLVRSLKPKREEPKRFDPAEPLPLVEEIAPGQQETLLTQEEKASTDSPEILPGEKETADAQEASLEEREKEFQEEAVRAEEIVPEEKEPPKDPQEFPANETLADIQQRLALLEEKTNSLEDLVLQLEGKVADLQETQMKSEPKIDLQTILSNLDEKHQNML